MDFFYKINKPEYIFKPKQLIKRLTKRGIEEDSSTMPWEYKLHYNHKDDIGRAINILGIYELPLTELLYRTLFKVNHFADIGANIGYYTSLAGSIKHLKSITSFEPHPVICETLQKNIDETKNKNIKLEKIAASSEAGTTSLYIPKDFDKNMGIASLEKPEEHSEEIKIETKKLDNILEIPSGETCCIKIDTEGHEASVLAGASDLLESQKLRYIFFEEFNSYPEADTFKILKSKGYVIYRLERSFFGPFLTSPENKIVKKQWQPINYFALHSNDKSIDELKKSGWNILSL